MPFNIPRPSGDTPPAYRPLIGGTAALGLAVMILMCPACKKQSPDPTPEPQSGTAPAVEATPVPPPTSTSPVIGPWSPPLAPPPPPATVRVTPPTPVKPARPNYGRPLRTVLSKPDPMDFNQVYMAAGRTEAIEECSAWADGGSLVLSLRVNVKKWDTDGSLLSLPLVVRVYDRDGNYLTHFRTSEVFSTIKEKVEHDNFLNRHVPTRPKAVLLSADGHVLRYPVNRRDLEHAATVAVCFYYVD